MHCFRRQRGTRQRLSEQQGLSAEEEVCDGFLLCLLFITGRGPSSPGPASSSILCEMSDPLFLSGSLEMT